MEEQADDAFDYISNVEPTPVAADANADPEDGGASNEQQSDDDADDDDKAEVDERRAKG